MYHKKFFSFLAAALLCAQIFAADLNWGVDLEAAKKEAGANKIVLLLISGQTWCGPCMRFDKEVLDSSRFKGFAKKNLALVQVDIKSDGSLTREGAADAQKAAKKKYGTGYVPAVILIDPASGDSLALEHPSVMTPNAFVREIQKFMKAHKKEGDK